MQSVKERKVKSKVKKVLKEIDLLNHTFPFAIRTIKSIRVFPDNTELKVIKHQLIKSVTSIGANYEEAQEGSSKADFTHKVKIALKEARIKLLVEDVSRLKLLQYYEHFTTNTLCSIV